MPLAVLAILVLILPGCSQEKKEQLPEKVEVVDAVAEKPDPLQGQVTSIRGTVLEVVESGSFTFILLDRGKKQSWATIPAVDVKVGEEITLSHANVFSNFHSKSIDRTFEELIFSTGIEGKSSLRKVVAASPK